MEYICTKCGLISETEVLRYPECLGEVRKFPKNMKHLEESIRNSQQLLRLVGNDVNINLKKATST